MSLKMAGNGCICAIKKNIFINCVPIIINFKIIFKMKTQNTEGNCHNQQQVAFLTSKAKLLAVQTPTEAAELLITLMRAFTESEEYAEMYHIDKSDMWYSVNLIRSVLLNLDK